MKNKDQQLLEEAYTNILQPNIILSEASLAWRNIPLNQLQESTSPEIIEELLSGLKSMAQSAWGNIKQAGQTLATKATQTASGVKSAAQQVGQNAKNLYNTGEKENAAMQKAEHAATLVSQIQNIVSELIAANPIIGKEFQGKDPMSFTLGQIHSALQRGLESKQRAVRSATSKSNSAKEHGLFGGVKQAFQTGSAPRPESGKA